MFADETVSLGIDLGTSELKGILLSGTGVVIGKAGEALSIQRPHEGWAEQHPDIWWRACLSVLSSLRQAHPTAYARVGCIGLSGQMHGAVLLNRRNECIRPAILWNDARSAEQAAKLHEAHPSFAAVIGSVPMAGFTAPKLLWLKEHEPELFEAVDCVLTPKDYLRLKLTGERISDVSDAAGTLWLDIAKRAWFLPIIEATGLTPKQLPRLVEGPAIAGEVSAAVANELGLRPGVVLAGGGGDGPVSGVGIGAIEDGDSFVTLGTSAAVMCIGRSPLGNAEAGVHGYCHALPGRWYAMGAILSGASCLSWLSRLLVQGNVQTLLEQTERTYPVNEVVPAGTPFFLPYLSGERTPHNDPLARGGFMNLSHNTDSAALGYAVIEGVGFALLDALHSVESAGAVVSRCSLVGGGARSAYWAQLLSNVLQRELVTYHDSALSAPIGAAKLAYAALGYSSLIGSAPAQKASFAPNAALAGPLNARYEKFRGLFLAVKGLHD